MRRSLNVDRINVKRLDGTDRLVRIASRGSIYAASEQQRSWAMWQRAAARHVGRHHLLSLIDAVLAWVERAQVRLRGADRMERRFEPTRLDAEQHAEGA